MSSEELKEKTFYLVQTPFIKGRFQYIGEVNLGGCNRYLEEGEICYCEKY